MHPDLKHWKTQDTQHILSCSDLKLARNLGRALCDGGRTLATLAVIWNSILKWPTDFNFVVADTSSTDGTHSDTSSCVQQTVYDAFQTSEDSVTPAQP